MNGVTVIFMLTGILCHSVNGAPQSTDPVLQAAIDSVFNTGATSPPRVGPGTVVTPVPNFVPTTAPQTLISNTGEQCTCVPYHMCDPQTNSTRGELPNNNGVTGNPNVVSDQDLIDGFGQIDIRFDPDDCQDVLDVCCRGANRKEETVSVPPVATQPNRAAGCGIRNVGGIDFQITGAFVRNAFQKIKIFLTSFVYSPYDIYIFLRIMKLDLVNSPGPLPLFVLMTMLAFAVVH